MKRKTIAFAAGTLLTAAAGMFDAILPAGSAPVRTAHAGNPAASAFTYQGQLKHNGQPVVGPVNLVFRLFDAAAGGNNLGQVSVPGAVLGEGGLLKVDLDFGIATFDGNERWLEIVVNNNMLTPRQAIRPAPYALRALSGGDSVWLTNGSHTHYDAGNVGIGTAAPWARLSIVQSSNAAPGAAVVVDAPGSIHAGVLSENFADGPGVVGTGFGNDGVRGFTEATGRSGVFGQTVNPVGHGVFGRNTAVSSHGYLGGQFAGAAGLSNATQGEHHGVFGESKSDQGNGVSGIASATTGENYGVYGETKSGQGYGGYFVGGFSAVSGRSGSIGVYGLHTGTSGSFPGVWGETQSNSNQSNGVRGIVISTSPGAFSSGVRGINNGTGSAGIGVWGSHAGSGWGVYGSVSTGGRGVVGEAAGNGWGVHGLASAGGRGVMGEATGDGRGVYGLTETGSGVYGQATHVVGYAGTFIGARSYFSGNIGIGQLNPTFLLHLSQDSAAKPTSNTWTISSDARLKKNIHTIQSALDDLLLLRGVTYEWTDPDSQGGMTGTYTGLIAQEVENVFPEWIRDDADGFKTLTVIGFEGLVVEALRELVIRGEEKDAELAVLRAEHDQVKAQLQQLERLVHQLLVQKTGASQ